VNKDPPLKNPLNRKDMEKENTKVKTAGITFTHKP